MFGDIKRHKLFFIVVVLILFLSFAFNIFGAVTTDSFISNYKDSESLVSNQIKCKGKIFNNQLLQIKSEYTTDVYADKCSNDMFVPYMSQFGLQGKAYTIGFKFLSKIISINYYSYIALAQIITALMSALVLGLFILWVRSRISMISSSITTLLIACSPMIVGFSRNLYWALPVLILPLVFIMYYYQVNYKGWRLFLFWFILGVLLCVRYLCGYEYITTITIMVISAIVFYLYANKEKFKSYVRQIVTAGAVSVLAFSVALGTHVFFLNSYTGSTSKSISIIMNRAEERTVNADKYLEYPYLNLKWLANDYYKTVDTYLKYDQQVKSGSVASSMLAAFVNYMLLPVVSLPIVLNPSFGLYFQSMAMFILVIVFLFIKRDKWIDKKISRQIKALFFALFVGLIGYFSWIVLAYSHAMVHAHINGILMYLPFALFGYVIFGVFIEYIINKIKIAHTK